MTRSFVILFVFMVFGFGNCQINSIYSTVIRVQCAKVPLVRNLNLTMLVGEWYEITRTPNPWESGDCTQINQIVVNEGNELRMHWEEISPRQQGQNTYKFAVSRGIPPEDDLTAKLSLNFTLPSLEYLTPFHIVDTDYDSYLVVYSCHRQFIPNHHGVYYTEYAWIMARTRSLDRNRVINLRQSLQLSSVHTLWMYNVNQVNCNERYKEVRPPGMDFY